MVIGITLFVLIVLIVGIYVLVEIRRLKHKLFAIFLIGLILFSYLSFTIVLKNKDVDLKTVPGMIKAGKLYFLWMWNVFGNMATITGNAINMDWGSVNNSDTDFSLDLLAKNENFNFSFSIFNNWRFNYNRE